MFIVSFIVLCVGEASKLVWHKPDDVKRCWAQHVMNNKQKGCLPIHGGCPISIFVAHIERAYLAHLQFKTAHSHRQVSIRTMPKSVYVRCPST